MAPRRFLRALCLAAGVAGLALPASGAARMTILYDLPETVEEMVAPAPDATHLSAAFDALFQQGTVRAVLGPGRVAGKAASGTGSELTPSLRGLDGPSIAAVLRDLVDGSSANLAFIDELDASFAGAGGEPLAAALATLAQMPYPGGGSYADRVHVYVRVIRAMLLDPDGYAAAWRALAQAGGAWLEAYTGSGLPVTPWAPELWLAWPRAFGDELVRRGGRRDRLHVLMSSGTVGDQAVQWELARTGTDPGAACAVLANGPGAYRLSSVDASAADFVDEFRLSFPAPGGTPIGCGASPALAPPLAQALGGVLGLEGSGATLAAGAITGGPLVAGQPSTVTVALPGGADPLGIAGGLFAGGAVLTPSAFWAQAAPTLIAAGPGGATASAPLSQGPGGSWQATLSLNAPAIGPVTLGLVLPGGVVRNALGPPADLALSLGPEVAADPGLAPTVRRLLADPLNWRLNVPLGPPGQPLGAALVVGNPAPVVSAVSPATTVAGGGPMTLTVAGGGFVPGAVVRWNGADRPTTVVGAGTLTAAIPATDLGLPGAAAITVATPAPGGGVSGSATFTIAPPPPPTARTRPRVAGAGRLGAVLRCSPGTWTGTPTRFAYTWLRDGRPAGTGVRHRVVAGDLGRAVTCRVSATNLGGSRSVRSAALPVRLPRLELAAARRVRVGRPVVLRLRLSAPAPPVRAVVQVRVARGWRALAAVRVRGRTALAVVRRPRGAYRLRVRAPIAGRLVTSPSVTVSVRR